MLEDDFGLALVLMDLAKLAAVFSRQGDGVAAARLLGAAETLYGIGRAAAGYAENPGDRQLNESTSAAVRAALGEGDYTRAVAEGRALPIDAAIGLALGHVS